MTTEYFVSRTSYNRATRRENYRSRSFKTLQDAQMCFSETMIRAIGKSRKNEGYTCTITLSEQTDNIWKQLRREEV